MSRAEMPHPARRIDDDVFIGLVTTNAR